MTDSHPFIVYGSLCICSASGLSAEPASDRLVVEFETYVCKYRQADEDACCYWPYLRECISVLPEPCVEQVHYRVLQNVYGV